jgi:hypothetical protein
MYFIRGETDLPEVIVSCELEPMSTSELDVRIVKSFKEY